MEVENESSQVSRFQIRVLRGFIPWPVNDSHPGGWDQGSLVPEAYPQRYDARMENRCREMLPPIVKISLEPLRFKSERRSSRPGYLIPPLPRALW